MRKTKYIISAPKYYDGEFVSFFLHNSTRVEVGRIQFIETRYSRDFKAYHVYSIMIPGRQRHLHVAERFILELQKSNA